MTQTSNESLRIIIAPLSGLLTKDIVSEIFNVHRDYINEGLIGFRPAVSYADAVDKGQVLLAMLENEIVGFAHFRKLKRTNDVRLYAIAVKREHCGKGIGSKLIDRLKAHMGKSLITEVRDLNYHSMNFFVKNGFKMGNIEKRKSYSVIPFTFSPLWNEWYYDDDRKEVTSRRKF